jgi:SAM-dependent methyltransferase
MAIAPYVAEAIIREHKYRAIRGDVLLLGRQTMQFTPQHAGDMIKAVGLVPAALPDDDSVIDRQTWRAEGQKFIRDDAFFRLLGVPEIRALDHSGYEGAEIIHDLNRPIPAHLENTADFILDGSTLDNLFSPATAIQSVARMLRPGGRFLSVNMQSFHSDSYSLTNPYWFLDFFTVNGFADCRVYATTHGDRGELNVYAVDPTARRDRAFRPLEVTGLMVFAEKGADSTWEAIPSQRYYSAADEIEKRVAAGRRFRPAGGRSFCYRSARSRSAGCARSSKSCSQKTGRWRISAWSSPTGKRSRCRRRGCFLWPVCFGASRSGDQADGKLQFPAAP